MIRGILFQMSFWITNTNGLLNQYFQSNASNYKALKTKTSQGQVPGSPAYKRPINYRLTSIALQFLKRIFNFNEKFIKKFENIEEIQVFYIRMHHTNFVRLYNKNKKYLRQLNQIEVEIKEKVKMN